LTDSSRKKLFYFGHIDILLLALVEIGHKFLARILKGQESDAGLDAGGKRGDNEMVNQFWIWLARVRRNGC
jgi:hypothetical protein